MLYHFYESTRNLLAPWVYQAKATADFCNHPRNLWSSMPGTDYVAAMNELFYRIGKDYEKPDWNIPLLKIDGDTMPVMRLDVLQKPFCNLLRFRRYSNNPEKLQSFRNQPSVLVVAPLSGHHATLLRDTVRSLMQHYRVYVTDWVDARMVPAEHGDFGLDDYVEYVQDFIRHIGTENLHVVSVCQPVVPVLGAISLMAARGEPTPQSMIMMGGPIDARLSPTAVNDLAMNNPLMWFKNNVVYTVPALYPGKGRHVYPGFLQHTGFLAMNPRRHLMSHWNFYNHLVKGDMDDAAAHRRFYDEYNAVLDIPAKFYLDTIEVVFQKFLLPRGEWFVRGEHVDPSAIRDTALLSIEGELDDISGLGQTQATQQLCSAIPDHRRSHFLVKEAGHYGIFSGRRWREVVYPRIHEFISSLTPPTPPSAAVAPEISPPPPEPTPPLSAQQVPVPPIESVPAPQASASVQPNAAPQSDSVEIEIEAEAEAVTPVLEAAETPAPELTESLVNAGTAETADDNKPDADATIEITAPAPVAAEESSVIQPEVAAIIDAAIEGKRPHLRVVEVTPPPVTDEVNLDKDKAEIDDSQNNESGVPVAIQAPDVATAAEEPPLSEAVKEEADSLAADAPEVVENTIQPQLQAIIEVLQPKPRKSRKNGRTTTNKDGDVETE